jgi:hypothetical protein
MCEEVFRKTDGLQLSLICEIVLNYEKPG